ncbi:MAG: DUF6607 family protein [Gammaproteobacteria bacterium]
MNQPLFIIGVCGALSLCACVSSPTTAPAVPRYTAIANADFATITEAETSAARDHRAILAMTGEHRVDFHFEETVRLAAGYERHDDKTTGGFETVIALVDEPGRVVLQHLLVASGGHVVKHWRQDWTYEASERFEFSSDQTWSIVPLTAEQTDNAWTQCVYEVSDAPRYCGTGKWNHRYGVSTWTSDRTWRPLPRREYTKRDDYNAINAENRHTVTPQGWSHEQDNTKVLRVGEATQTVLVREFGYNDYQRVRDYDFQPAYDYWAETKDYWAQVRSAWQQRLDGAASLTLTTTVDGMPIIIGTFDQAARATSTSAEEQRAQIDALLNQWTQREIATVNPGLLDAVNAAR